MSGELPGELDRHTHATAEADSPTNTTAIAPDNGTPASNSAGMLLRIQELLGLG